MAVARSWASLALVASIALVGSAPAVAGEMPALPSDPPAAPSTAPASATTRPEAPRELAWRVVSRRPHDPAAYTQGLQLDGDGRLFESTGRLGRSTIREVDPGTGLVERVADLPADHFGEGLALVGDRLIQLTWRSGIATVRDLESFEELTAFRYEGEGWGLCYDGRRLLMSDGSDVLTVRDPETFEVLERIRVTLAGEPQPSLNELECVDGRVWANVYLTDRIVRIDPTDGRVDAVLDLAGILQPHPREARPAAVLNGIAWDAGAGTFLVTGKLWPELIEIEVAEG